MTTHNNAAGICLAVKLAAGIVYVVLYGFVYLPSKCIGSVCCGCNIDDVASDAYEGLQSRMSSIPPSQQSTTTPSTSTTCNVSSESLATSMPTMVLAKSPSQELSQEELWQIFNN